MSKKSTHKLTNKILLGDCLEITETIPDNTIDLVFADYPFNCQDKRKNYLKFVEDTVCAFHRICKPEANLLVINNPINCFKTSQYYKQHFFLRQSIALIRKGAFYPAWHLGFKHNTALMLMHSDNKKIKWNGSQKNHKRDFGEDVIEYQNGFRMKGKKWHPQAIPLSLAEHFIGMMSNVNDTVFIPFVGSGTECIACTNLERKYIGTEFSNKYYEMAQERIRLRQEQIQKIDAEREKIRQRIIKRPRLPK